MADATTPELLTVLSVEDPRKARELLLACMRLAGDGKLGLKDAVFVDRSPDGERVRVQQTLDMSPGQGAMTGGLWGLLVGTLVAGPVGLVIGAASAAGGALIGQLVDAGVDEHFVEHVKDLVEPGRSAVILLTTDMDQPAFRAEMERFKGTRLLHSDLPPVARTWLQNALGDGASHSAVDLADPVPSPS